MKPIHTGWLALLAAVQPAQPSYAQEPLGLSAVQRPFQRVDESTIQADQRFTFVCPASDGANATVYGTDVYTADSAVCAAAIHAGVLRQGQPGSVTVVMGSGAESFPGSTRNGVTSRGYGPWDWSYTFARGGAPGMVTWRTVWSGVPDDFVAPITVECPAKGSTGGKIFGTDVYTRDTVICVAAVHAGAIAAENGGVVVVTRARHGGEFTASVRNGVASQSYGPFRDAFNVTGTRTSRAVAPAAPPEPITGLNNAPIAESLRVGGIVPPAAAALGAARTIALPGFTAQGVVVSPPRTIALAGFAATGVAPPANPKTVTLTGWTATGNRQ
jgi:hypothetical protein